LQASIIALPMENMSSKPCRDALYPLVSPPTTAR
jgi:hypothetical protein